MHAEESAVKHILSLKKGSKERHNAFQTITCKGNFVYNKCIYRDTSKSLITKKNPNSKSKSRDYLPCQYCYGFYKKSWLNKHVEKCNLKPLIDAKTKAVNKKELSILSSLLLEYTVRTEINIVEFLSSLDAKFKGLFAIAKKDELVIKYGFLLLNTKEHRKKTG